MSFTQPARPACVVKPENADEVHRLVNLANNSLVVIGNTHAYIGDIILYLFRNNPV